MNRNTLAALLLAPLLTLLTCACSSSRDTARTPDPGMSRELAAAGERVESLGQDASESFATAVARTYAPWSSMTLKGKVRLEGVPVPLNVKIYMEHARSLILSLSAPLLGEMGRVEMTADSVLFVNKRAKTWCREPIAPALGRFGASLADIQDLLLGRVFMLGYGTLSPQNASQIEVSEGASDTRILTPRLQHPDAQYGFTLYPDGLMMMAAAFTPDERYLATADYTHREDGGTDMDISLKADTKRLSLSLSLEKPDTSPRTPLEPIAINPKWTRVTLSRWIKSLK